MRFFMFASDINRDGAAPLGNQEGGVPGPAPQGTHHQLLSVASVPSGSARTPRDGQIKATGTAANSRKRRKIAPPSPGVSGNGEAWPQLASNPERCGLIPSQSGQCWPRFVVVEAENPSEPLSKLSPWAIQKGFEGISPSITNIKCLGKNLGQFLVECPSEKISKMIMARNGTAFVDRKIKVSAHRTLNTSKGVVTSKIMGSFDLDHLTKGLEDQGVTNVQRLTKGKGADANPTNTYFLTFATPTPPEFIKIPFVTRIPVRMYIQKPLQCFKCWRFGHPQSKCQANAVCRHCGSQAHEGACPTPTKCGNCKGPHSPTDRSCPTYIKEATIQKVRAEQKISFAEARRFVEASAPTGKSFADAAASATGQQKRSPNQQIQPPKAPVAAPKPVRSQGTQFPDNLGSYELPDAIVAEALHLAKELRESFKTKKTKTASSQFSSEAHPPAPHDGGKKIKSKKPAKSPSKSKQGELSKTRKAQGNPGSVLKPPTFIFGENPNRPTSKGFEFGGPKGKNKKNPPEKKEVNASASAHQVAGAQKGPATPSAQAKPGKDAAPTKETAAKQRIPEVWGAPRIEWDKDEEESDPPMEVNQPPASAHQAAEGGAHPTSPSGRGAGASGSALKNPLSTLGAKIGELAGALSLGGKSAGAAKPKVKRQWRSASNLLGTKPLNLKNREEPSNPPPHDTEVKDPIPPRYPFEIDKDLENILV